MGSGYYGYSMSNRAVEAYEHGEKPISKWKKSDILEAIAAKYSEAFAESLEKWTLKNLRDKCLEKTSWHHTSKFYNHTDFYLIRDDLDFWSVYEKHELKQRAKIKHYERLAELFTQKEQYSQAEKDLTAEYLQDFYDVEYDYKNFYLNDFHSIEPKKTSKSDIDLLEFELEKNQFISWLYEHRKKVPYDLKFETKYGILQRIRPVDCHKKGILKLDNYRIAGGKNYNTYC